MICPSASRARVAQRDAVWTRPHGPGLHSRTLMFLAWSVGVKTSDATASFYPRHTLPSSRLLGATALAWRENPRSSHGRTRGPVSLLWYASSEEVRALCDLEVYANHCASIMTLLPWFYALLCSLTCLLLLMAETIGAFDIYPALQVLAASANPIYLSIAPPSTHLDLLVQLPQSRPRSDCGHGGSQCRGCGGGGS